MNKLLFVMAACVALLVAGCANTNIGKYPVGKSPVVTKY
jgi:outer membrane lipoprotein SlyB